MDTERSRYRVFLHIPAVQPRFSWGSLLPHLGYGQCYRCRRPWWATREFLLEYAPGQSLFALCVWCWHRSDPWWRFHAHRWLVSTWSSLTADEAEALLGAVHEAAWADDDAAWDAARQAQR